MSESSVVQETIPETEIEEKTDSKPKRQPPYAVILHNDDEHTFNYVIDVLRKVCGHSFLKALRLAVETHKAGRAMVWTGSLEVAELKRDQIRGQGPDFYARKPVTFPLGVSIEPLPVDQ